MDDREYCYITTRPERWVKLEFSYNPLFISGLKNIPAGDRTYCDDPDDRHWTVRPAYLEKVKGLAIQCFERAWFIDGTITVNLKTGEVEEQGLLFEGLI